ncbi:MAG: hypothetical protein HZA58_08815 [Acidimicrobiia bacterium]|nr:hypothetical protein [Acidimicrobiia bacterium]
MQVTTMDAGRVRVPVALAVGAGAGLLWGVAIRAWMRLISEDPEFTVSGSVFIVGAATIAGLGMAIAAAARRNHWRFGKIASVLGGILIVPLGTGAGSILLATVVGGGVALGRPRISLPVRLGILAPVVLLGTRAAGASSGVATALAGVVVLVLVVGYRTRLVLGILAAAPAALVIFGVLTSELPLWQRLAGAAAYPMLLAPILLWFARTVAPFPAER